MNEPATPTTDPDHDPLRLRHVLTIVLVGAALGAGFNALQRSADSSRGLAWVKRERSVVSLEALSPPPAATPVTAAPPAVPDPPAAEPRSAPPSVAITPVHADTVGQSTERARERQVKSSAKPVTPANAPPPMPAVAAPLSPPAAATTVSATAPTATPPAAVADLPVIPDSREPIEVGLVVAQRFHAAGAALFLDARSAEEYAEGHIAGAVSLPQDDVYKHPALAKGVDARGRVLITYCGGGDCDLSRNLAFALIDAGFRKVLVFKDGLPAWASAGRGVHKGTQP